MSKKTVKVPESELVTLMDKIVTEAVKKEKTNWIAEQDSKLEEKVNAILEAKLAEQKPAVNESEEVSNDEKIAAIVEGKLAK